MTKLTYINDQQFINDAADILIKEHLRWSGSNKSMPSRDCSLVSILALDAYLEANYTTEEWDKMSMEEREHIGDKVTLLYESAKQLADMKWEAAMTLLGIEA